MKMTDGWKMLTEIAGHKVQLVGDDLFTNVERLSRYREHCKLYTY
jgi:enolase